MLLLSSADFFSKLTFSKNLSGTLSECQKFFIQIRPHIANYPSWQRVKYILVLRTVLEDRIKFDL